MMKSLIFTIDHRNIFWILFNILVCVFHLAKCEPCNGIVRGRIVEWGTENPLIAANVMLTGTCYGCATDSNGSFEMFVPAGNYNLTASVMGYHVEHRHALAVKSGKAVDVLFEMQQEVVHTQGVAIVADQKQSIRSEAVSLINFSISDARTQVAGSLDMQRAMGVLPAVATGSDLQNQIIVRGGAPDENLFLLNDIELDNPNHFGSQGNGYGYISVFNQQLLEGVDFYAGAFPAQFGGKASSVMSYKMREGNCQKQTGSVYMDMGYTGATFGGPLASSKCSYLVGLQASSLEKVNAITGLSAVPKFQNYQGNITARIGLRHKLVLTGLYATDRIHIKEADAYSERLEQMQSSSGQWATGATLVTTFSRYSYSRLTLAETQNHWQYQLTRPDGELLSRTESTLKTKQFKYQLDFCFSTQNSVRLGLYYKQKYLDETAETRNALRSNSLQSQSDEWHQNQSAGFVQCQIGLSSRLIVTAGVRYMPGNQTVTSGFIPRFNMTYNLNSTLEAFFAYGQHKQVPCVGKQWSKEMEVHHHVLGIEQHLGNYGRARIEMYQKKYNHVPMPALYEAWNQTGNESHQAMAQGLEALFESGDGKHWNFTGSYALAHSHGIDPASANTYARDFDYRHQVTVCGGYSIQLRQYAWYQSLRQSAVFPVLAAVTPLADQFNIHAEWRYLSGRPCSEQRYSDEGQVWQPAGKYNEHRYSATHSLDIKIEKQVHMGGVG